jgi:hypothetical protein
LRRLRQKIAHAIDEFFEGESGGSRAGCEFSGHLAELTFTLGRFFLWLLVADESSCSLMRFEQTSEFQLAVSAHHRVGVDGEIDGKLADGGKLIAGGERSGCDSGAHLIDELAVNGDASVKVQGESEAAVLEDLLHK